MKFLPSITSWFRLRVQPNIDLQKGMTTDKTDTELSVKAVIFQSQILIYELNVQICYLLLCIVYKMHHDEMIQYSSFKSAFLWPPTLNLSSKVRNKDSSCWRQITFLLDVIEECWEFWRLESWVWAAWEIQDDCGAESQNDKALRLIPTSGPW